MSVRTMRAPMFVSDDIMCVRSFDVCVSDLLLVKLLYSVVCDQNLLLLWLSEELLPDPFCCAP